MSLSSGTRIGPYEIVSPIGAGGMGEVYRGRDTRLGRDVAIKILPAGFANEELRARFEREARTISSLNHPNICTLFDVGRHQESQYLVMELIEGDTLADRLQKGPLSLEQVLRCGAQIADALSCAHRQGIVHRDLKPGNIMLTRSGAKLLDFGLATAGASASPLQGLTTAGTQERPLTQEGTILGTFQYMAPEQLEGLEADARTDIFAFGTLLYEMATGRRAFDGRTRTSLIAAIVSSTPRPVGEIVPMTPPALEHVIRRCLAKDPDDRWQNAVDIASELRWIAEAGSRAGEAAPVLARRKLRLRAAWGLHAVTAAVAVLATLAVGRSLQEPSRLVRTSIMPPDHGRFDANAGAAVLSPDGRRFAFVGVSEDGKTLLWVRPVSVLTAQPLPGTEGATHPFWSPDGQQIGFFAAGKLKRIDASGGPPQPVTDAVQGRGGAWGPDGTILFTPTPGEPLHRVPASGGKAVSATELDPSRKETSHRFAEFLPDGRRFLYLVEGSTEVAGTDQGFAVFAGSLDSKEKTFVVASNGPARYSTTGHLLFLRSGSLIAQRFDPASLTLSGEGVPLAEKVRRTGKFEAAFSLSRNGLLLYQPGGASENARLVWMDRHGKEGDTIGKPADYRNARLSHDGTRIAATLVDPATQRSDVWVIDIVRGTTTKLTFDPENDSSPTWSADDQRIYFTSQRSGKGDVFVKSSFGTGTEEPVYGSPEVDFLQSLSPDGLFGWVQSNLGRQSWDTFRVNLRDGTASAFLATPYSEVQAAASPDGRWLAYSSDETGRAEVYVQSLSNDGGKWQVSTDGGGFPLWTRGGREIIYQGRDSKLIAVAIEAGATFSAGVPSVLFDPRMRSNIPGRMWDATPDGERFLVNRLLDTPEVEPLALIQNWPEGL
jgi:eukaryotic-like serine/threonine-protein kinase